MAFILDDTRNLREQPPRPLNIFTQIQILFGGFAVQFGALFFWFGMIFTLIFVGQSELVYLFTIDGEWVETTAVVQQIGDTGVTVNNESLSSYQFSFQLDNQTLQRTCYGTQKGINIGDVVPIEYTAWNTDRARIVGMTNKYFPSWIAVVLLFPIIGLIFLLLGFKSNINALYLVRNGLFTKGKKLSATPTNTRINNRTVYAFEF